MRRDRGDQRLLQQRRGRDAGRRRPGAAGDDEVEPALEQQCQQRLRVALAERRLDRRMGGVEAAEQLADEAGRSARHEPDGDASAQQPVERGNRLAQPADRRQRRPCMRRPRDARLRLGIGLRADRAGGGVIRQQPVAHEKTCQHAAETGRRVVQERARFNSRPPQCRSKGFQHRVGSSAWLAEINEFVGVQHRRQNTKSPCSAISFSAAARSSPPGARHASQKPRSTCAAGASPASCFKRSAKSRLVAP